MITKLAATWKKFVSRKYREAFIDAHLSSTIAAQINTMRHDRNLSQLELATLAGMKQARISVLEDPNNKSLSIRTLRRIASAFDVALIIRFVPYSAVARWSNEVEPGKFSVASFENDRIHDSTVIKTFQTPPNVLIIASNGSTEWAPPKANVNSVTAENKISWVH
jgi:transcriptional regulator with XRE-family HTH domain